MQDVAFQQYQEMQKIAFQHYQAGRLDDAEMSLRRAVTLKPDHPDAYSNLGHVLQQQGRLDQAINHCRKAITLKPDHPNAYSNLGNALQQQGHLDEAIECYRRAIAIKPDHPHAHNNLGHVLQEQGHLHKAVECYRRAIAIKPDYPHAHSNLGNALQQQGRLDQAINHCRKAITLKPDYPHAHNNLGNAFLEQGHLDQAVECYRRAIAIKPDYPHAHSNLGNALQQQGHLHKAVECYRRAIAIKPDYPAAHNNLGHLLQEQGLLDQAIEWHRRAIALKPDYADAHYNLAIALLAQGEMMAGWKEYEWRWQTSQMSPRNFTQPQWRGERAEGKTLLIYAEQGFGDTLQFCRYAPLAAARGLRVILEVPEALVRLLRTLPNVHEVITCGRELPHFDLHCPMLSMPLALQTTLTTIPKDTAYLYADEAQAATWRTRLSAMGKWGPRIGLVWAGRSDHRKDRQRSLPPDRLGALLDLRGVHFFSLQKGGPKAPKEFSLTDLMDEIKDFSDTAALIANLDLIVSVDTAVAHLAAALGKPVWLLDRFNSDWRWLRGRSDSPWYPTLRLYRQPHPGDWDSVLADVLRDLHLYSLDDDGLSQPWRGRTF